MKELFFYFFGYVVFFYSMALILSYLVMIVLAWAAARRHVGVSYAPYAPKLFAESPYTPGVSIIAGAYNEENVIVDSIESFLRQDYPKFEVVIVNDGSTDQTLERMIEHFALEEQPSDYVERIRTKPYRRTFRSKLEQYRQLTVVDKENGGTKADAINAGLNVAKYPWFINTDIDCVLSHDAVMQCVSAAIGQSGVIAVSGAMAMNNGCRIEEGEILERHVPHTPSPLFQSVEYLRSFAVGKMAWGRINAMPNVSGGYGLFNTEVCINAGGYDGSSFAEDMDMLIRMIRYCCDNGRDYRVLQIPETCCWTQGPPNIRQLYKQRTRWGRGLIETLSVHSGMIFNKRYRRLGLITLPYVTVFEFLAPVIEACGFVLFLYLALTGGVNWVGAAVISLSIFCFNYMLSSAVFFLDYCNGVTYGKKRSYLWLMAASLLEPILYHPLIVVFSLKGYADFLRQSRAKWGEMKRKKYKAGNDVENNGGPEAGNPAPEYPVASSEAAVGNNG